MSELEDEKTPKEQGEMASTLEQSMTERMKDVGLWRELWFQIKLVWYLMRDREVPVYLKILPVLAIIYTLVPTDLVPDLFPFIGQLDDITALLVGGKVFIELSPPHVVARYLKGMHAAAMSGSHQADHPDGEGLGDAIVIEGEFTKQDDVLE
jgi:uncharacterized membrane protein YkvA (DUF1232 family)